MSAQNQHIATSSNSNENLRGWFENLIDDIKVDQLMMETDSAPEHKRKFYTAASTGDDRYLASTTRQASSMFYLRKLIDGYFGELVARKKFPSVLALSLSDSKILVWAQIKNSDYATEKALILSEAKANSEYFDDGFYITSTIVEEEDMLPVPTGYVAVQLNSGSILH